MNMFNSKPVYLHYICSPLSKRKCATLKDQICCFFSRRSDILLRRQLLLRWYLQQQRVRVRVMIGVSVRGRVSIKAVRIRVRVGVTFNVGVYHWGNRPKSKCRVLCSSKPVFCVASKYDIVFWIMAWLRNLSSDLFYGLKNVCSHMTLCGFEENYSHMKKKTHCG